EPPSGGVRIVAGPFTCTPHPDGAMNCAPRAVVFALSAVSTSASGSGGGFAGSAVFGSTGAGGGSFAGSGLVWGAVAQATNDSRSSERMAAHPGTFFGYTSRR